MSNARETDMNFRGPARPVPARALINARIHTMAPRRPMVGAEDGPTKREGAIDWDPPPAPAPWTNTAQALLWEGDTILAVGSNIAVLAEARQAKATVEDLSGRIVLPGFVDAHMHFIHAGLKGLRPDLRGATSLQDCMGRLTAWLQAHPGQDAVTGEGWDESGWGQRVRPTRTDLDAAALAAGQVQRPIVLRRIDGHIAVANSAALPAIRKRWDDDALVDMERGILLEEASLYLNEALPAPAQLLDSALAAACRIAHSHGVTTLGDYSQAPFRSALQRAAARGVLTVRVASSIYVQQLEAELAAGFRTGRRGLCPNDEAKVPPAGSDAGVMPGRDGGDAAVGGSSPFLRDGGLKVFLDGSLGAHTAALREPYFADGTATKGKLNWSDPDVERFFGMAHAAGVQVHAHAIGDAAIDQGLSAFAKIAATTDVEGSGSGANAMRHRFEHYEIVHDEQLRRTAELGIVASSQPNFVGEWSAKGGMYEDRLGQRFHLNNRFQAMKRAGVTIAFGSDGMPFGPLVGIQAAVQHPTPSEAMAPLEAVWHYTWLSAWSLHWENQVGSLEAGKKADFLVLEETDLQRPPAAWRIRETFVGGKVRFRRGRD